MEMNLLMELMDTGLSNKTGPLVLWLAEEEPKLNTENAFPLWLEENPALDKPFYKEIAILNLANLPPEKLLMINLSP